MLWTEIAIGREIPDGELVRVFAAAFGVEPAAVRVADGFLGATDEEIDRILDRQLQEPQDDRMRMRLERSHTSGDFPLSVEVAFYDDGLGALVAGDDRATAMYRRIARDFDAGLLVDDGDVNPSSYRLVTPDGKITPVHIDTDRLDDGALVIVKPVSPGIQRDLLARR